MNKKTIIIITVTVLISLLIGYKIGWEHRQHILNKKIEEAKKELDQKFKGLKEQYNIK